MSIQPKNLTWLGVDALCQSLKISIVCLGLLLTICQLDAQPVSYELDPSKFSDNDVISLSGFVGTESEPAENVLSLSLVFSPSIFTIDPSSEISFDLENTWLCDDGNCSVEYSISTEGNKLTIIISRTDNQAISGFGLMFMGGGIIVQVEDLSGKKPIGSASSIELLAVRNESILSEEIRLFPNPVREQFNLKNLDPEKNYRIELLTLQGKLVQNWESKGSQTFTGEIRGIKSGYYLLKYVSGNTTNSQLIRIQ